MYTYISKFPRMYICISKSFTAHAYINMSLTVYTFISKLPRMYICISKSFTVYAYINISLTVYTDIPKPMADKIHLYT